MINKLQKFSEKRPKLNKPSSEKFTFESTLPGLGRVPPVCPLLSKCVDLLDLNNRYFEISNIRIVNSKKRPKYTNPHHESIFFFSGVVQLGLPSIFSDEILRNRYESAVSI